MANGDVRDPISKNIIIDHGARIAGGFRPSAELLAMSWS